MLYIPSLKLVISLQTYLSKLNFSIYILQKKANVINQNDIPPNLENFVTKDILDNFDTSHFEIVRQDNFHH